MLGRCGEISRLFWTRAIFSLCVATRDYASLFSPLKSRLDEKKREEGSIKGSVFRTRANFSLFLSDRNVEGESFGNVEGGKKRDKYKGVLLK